MKIGSSTDRNHDINSDCLKNEDRYFSYSPRYQSSDKLDKEITRTQMLLNSNIKFNNEQEDLKMIFNKEKINMQ